MPFAVSIAERMFYEDIKQKRKAGRGSFHKKGKGVKHHMSGIKTAYDFMSTKEKKELNGAVTVTNMYSLTDIKTFKSYTNDRQVDIMKKWRETFTAKQIQEALGINHNEYYKLMHNLGILKRSISHRKPKGAKNSRNKPDATESDIMKYNDLKLLPWEKQLKVLDNYNDTYNMASVAKIWDKDIKQLYSWRYSLNKKAKKMVAIEPNDNKHKQEMSSIEIDNIEQNSDTTTEIPNNERFMELFQAEESPTEPTALSFDDVMKIQMKQEIEELRLVVQEQANLMENFMRAQQTLATAEDPDPQNSAAAFIMNFEKENEGFILYGELQRFIRVLEKNPDKFHANIEIRRIEE